MATSTFAPNLFPSNPKPLTVTPNYLDPFDVMGMDMPAGFSLSVSNWRLFQNYILLFQAANS